MSIAPGNLRRPNGNTPFSLLAAYLQELGPIDGCARGPKGLHGKSCRSFIVELCRPTEDPRNFAHTAPGPTSPFLATGPVTRFVMRTGDEFIAVDFFQPIHLSNLHNAARYGLEPADGFTVDDALLAFLTPASFFDQPGIADELFGQNGNNTITGSAFSDLVFGGAGDGFSNHGFGVDRVKSGTGRDKFFHVGVKGHGSDWVQDYRVAWP